MYFFHLVICGFGLTLVGAMSYYTKYRPQTIAELDLVGVRESFKHILSSGTFSHAYLFTGPKGTGKTSSARILAKVLNCDTNRQQGTGGRVQLKEPCNECENCRRITNGSSMACMEMDAASNRGIDDIRVLKERVGLLPAEGRFAVYIIDEVHMLTTEAFNALLKTLEEPPAHAIFILCTTDPQKIPATVISRCTRVLFQKASVDEVMHSLEKAVAGEKLTVESGVLQAIAERVDGSFRDGMKLLEQVAQMGSEVTLARVDDMSGYGQDYAVEPLIQLLQAKKLQAALAELNDKQQRGVDVGVFSKRLVETLRQQWLEIVVAGKVDNDLMLLTQAAATAAAEVKRAVLPVLPLELMVAEWCLSGDSLPAQAGVQGSASSSSQVEEKKPELTPVKPSTKTVVEEKKEEYKPPANAYGGTAAEVKEKWQEILLAVRPLNHSLEGVLRSARPAAVEDGWLTIEAFYTFHKERLEQDRHRKLLEQAMSTVLGGAVCLKFVLGERAQQVAHSPNNNLSGDVVDDALVKAAEEVFGN